ncbi:MAG: imidazole glycerol phosphate synthase subunit HisH [Phycisphaeraceae bacterium]|nr:imidazole glycerol phosphate synthase subunit HisH [Phycisphaeraceae bacterium]
MVACFNRCEQRVRVVSDARIIASASCVVLPGVGNFAAAMEVIECQGLREVLCRRIQEGRATLCICLGMQVLFEASEESPGISGLGAVKGCVRKLGGPRVPHMGWNRVEPGRVRECAALNESTRAGEWDIEPGEAYYAHSFAAQAVPEGWRGAWSHHGEAIVGAMWRRHVLACQFHPELSGRWGERLVRSWLEYTTVRAEEVTC